MKQYLHYCFYKPSGETATEVLSETNMLKRLYLIDGENKVPKGLLKAKSWTQYDEYSNTTMIHTLTRIS
jgi:hypothetical protein